MRSAPDIASGARGLESGAREIAAARRRLQALTAKLNRCWIGTEMREVNETTRALDGTLERATRELERLAQDARGAAITVKREAEAQLKESGAE